jgi:tetratricopeptide (TPR) repeat protein
MTRKQSLSFTDINQAWILHREEIETTKDGVCNVYVLLDAHSKHCFGQEMSMDLPASSKIMSMLETSFLKAKARPKQILISKQDPFIETFQAICTGLKIPLMELTTKELLPFVKEFADSFRQFRKGSTTFGTQLANTEIQSEVELVELKAFAPDSYSLCPCSSGKKFKFCCQKAFKDIAFAMCAAEEGQLEEALRFMKSAEEKVGRTAEIVCRIAICWSYYDMEKCHLLLKEAMALNPNHPRVNYIFGIEAVAALEYEKAISFYRTAIENYPPEDKYHLNETYNNLGTAYFRLKKYKEAKEVWEKGLVIFPTDKMTKNNLFKYIYDNPILPKELQEIGPFIKKYLDKWPAR